MNRTIILDDNLNEIEYHYYFKNNKRIYLRVNKEGEIIVTAPKRTLLEEIDLFVKSNSKWIDKKKKQIKDKQTIYTGEDKEWIYHLGKKYPIFINETHKTNIVLTPQGLIMDISIPYIKLDVLKTVSSWRKFTAKYICTACLKKVYQLFETKIDIYPNLKIRTTTSRWGSYSPKTNSIMINSELIKYPINCIEFVIAHELCHIKHLDHGKNFYKLLSEVMPDYQYREKILKSFPN